MERLELKHLAPYLPYKLMVKTERDNVRRMKSLHQSSIMTHDYHRIVEFKSFKPILRPLSDLTKGHIDELGKSVYIKLHFESEMDILSMKTPTKTLIICIHTNKGVADEIPLYLYNFLIKNHFDVFGLIEKGLAIDINTLKQ